MTDVQREHWLKGGPMVWNTIVPQERMMREIFQGGKEVMPKDK